MKTPFKQWLAGLVTIFLITGYYADAKPSNEGEEINTTSVSSEPAADSSVIGHDIEITKSKEEEQSGDGEVRIDPEVAPEPYPESPPGDHNTKNTSMVGRVREYLKNINLSSIPFLSKAKLMNPVNTMVRMCGDDLLDFENYDTATDVSFSDDSDSSADAYGIGGENYGDGSSQEEDCVEVNGDYKSEGKIMTGDDISPRQYPLPPPGMMGGYFPGPPFPHFPPGYNPGYFPPPHPYGFPPGSPEQFPPPVGPPYPGPLPYPGPMPYPEPMPYPGPLPYNRPQPFPEELGSLINQGSGESQSSDESRSKEGQYGDISGGYPNKPVKPGGNYGIYPSNGMGNYGGDINHNHPEPGLAGGGTGYYPSYGGMIPDGNESGSFISEQDSSEYSDSSAGEEPVTSGYSAGDQTGGKPPCRPRNKAIGSGRALLTPFRLHCRAFKSLLYRLRSANNRK